LPPTSPVAGKLSDLDVGNRVAISWGNALTAPGLIAGGTGGVEAPAPGASFPDQRDITGRYELIPSVDPDGHGVRTGVALKATKLLLDMHDSIDFCPGALTKHWWTKTVALTLSRLERTPYAGGGTYAAPVLFHISTALDATTVDITSLYPTNDPDHDGVPDSQPWQGATYKLDNCPGVPNHDQADSVGDGVGDACRQGNHQWTGSVDFDGTWKSSDLGVPSTVRATFHWKALGTPLHSGEANDYAKAFGVPEGTTIMSIEGTLHWTQAEDRADPGCPPVVQYRGVYDGPATVYIAFLRKGAIKAFWSPINFSFQASGECPGGGPPVSHVPLFLQDFSLEE
jgi:hypothetical protein